MIVTQDMVNNSILTLGQNGTFGKSGKLRHSSNKVTGFMTPAGKRSCCAHLVLNKQLQEHYPW